MYKFLIFDLDGTVLDTIDDICYAVNLTLEACGHPWRYDRESTKTLIGDGAVALIHRALRDKDDSAHFEEMKPIYMKLYREHQTERARPFDGLNNVLCALRRAGVRMAVVTNKPDALAQTILTMHFGEGFFEKIYGIKDGDPVKPDPYFVHKYMKEAGADPKDCLYVGDSHVDIATARNAGIKVALCGWGYEADYEAIVKDADYSLTDPEDLQDVVLGK